MKPRTTAELAILCVSGVMALALLIYGLHGSGANGKAIALLAVALSVGTGAIAWFRHLTASKRTQVELAGGQQYRQLADEYRRLADLAITAQEHTDLKLAEVSAQLDFLREQNSSMHKILTEVE